MTKIHLCITARENYARWACLCINSLIRRGGVAPSDIIVSIYAPLLGSRAAGMLRSMGVTLRVYGPEETVWSKFALLDRLFGEFPAITRVVQLDCDICLTEDLDFIGVVDGLTSGFDMLSYLAPSCRPTETFVGRSALYHSGFSPSGPPVSRNRLDAFLTGTFGFSLDSFEMALPELPWTYGGVMVIDRSLTHSLAWRSMVAFSYICACDETAVALAMHQRGNPIRWAPISQRHLPHRVNPPVLSLVEGPGLVHYAGDWYRVRNEANRMLLDAAFDELSMSLPPQ
jgi:hypothetical protein